MGVQGLLVMSQVRVAHETKARSIRRKHRVPYELPTRARLEYRPLRPTRDQYLLANYLDDSAWRDPCDIPLRCGLPAAPPDLGRRPGGVGGKDASTCVPAQTAECCGVWRWIRATIERCDDDRAQRLLMSMKN